MTDTATIIHITLRDLQWFVFAVRNVQTRTPGEAAMRGEMAVEFDRIIEANPTMREPFAIPFTSAQLLLCAWAANEGRCRDGDEIKIREALLMQFR